MTLIWRLAHLEASSFHSELPPIRFEPCLLRALFFLAGPRMSAAVWVLRRRRLVRARNPDDRPVCAIPTCLWWSTGLAPTSSLPYARQPVAGSGVMRCLFGLVAVGGGFSGWWEVVSFLLLLLRVQ